MQQVSPTVFRRRVSDAVYGAWLMEYIATDHHRDMAVAIREHQRPSFIAGYWDAFCEAHPIAANVVALVGWYVAVMLTSMAAFQVLMWEVR